MAKRLIITIDGPAASGKSTAARLLAERLGADFLDTGAMYRAVTLAAMQDGAGLGSEKRLLEVLKKNRFRFTVKAHRMQVAVNGVDVTEQIREPQVTANASYIASAAGVREQLVEMQRQFAAGCEKVVTEGRDQGTVVFPDADVKFYLTADINERAKRRLAELAGDKTASRLEETKKAIEARDRSDESRTVGPLKPAEDAVIVDTTDLTIEQVVEKLMGFVRQRGY